MTRIFQLVRGVAARVRGPGGLPSLVLAGMAAVSVALACKGADWALETVKVYGVGCLAGLAVLSAAVCSRMMGRPALLALHLGFALVLGGWVVNEVGGGEEGCLKLGPGQSGDVAGTDQLTLQSFVIDRWEDTGTVRQYTSKVRNEKGENLEISVNHPLVVRPWWVYQSSYQEMANPRTGEVARDSRTGEPLYFTILLCVKDVGLPLVAFGAVLLLLGAFAYVWAYLKRTASFATPVRRVTKSVWGLYALAFLGAVAMLVHRGFSTGHPPMQNMYEFLICTAALLPALTFVSLRFDRRDTLLVDSILLAVVLIPVGFFLLTVGLVLGAAWGKVCWGHWWQFDPKEMWSLATWLLYAAYFHLRPRLSPRADRVFLVAGALMVVLTLTWINLSRLFTGMHSYA